VIHELNTTAQLNISTWNYCACQTICTTGTFRLWHKNYRLCNSKRYRPTY